jgi:hypothetical protein
LTDHAKTFHDLLEKNEPSDNIQVPQELSPTTNDNNVIYVDPDPGPYSPPNPVSPNQRPKYFKASLESPDDGRDTSSGAMPGMYQRLRSRVVNSALAGDNPSNPPAPPPQSDPQFGIYSGKPMRQWIVPPPIWGRR